MTTESDFVDERPLKDEFDNLELNESQEIDSQKVKEEARKLMASFKSTLPETRYKSLAVTHLEIAMMFYSKALSRS